MALTDPEPHKQAWNSITGAGIPGVEKTKSGSSFMLLVLRYLSPESQLGGVMEDFIG